MYILLSYCMKLEGYTAIYYKLATMLCTSERNVLFFSIPWLKAKNMMNKRTTRKKKWPIIRHPDIRHFISLKALPLQRGQEDARYRSLMRYRAC